MVPELRPYPGADDRYGVDATGQAWSSCSGSWRQLKPGKNGAVSIRMLDGRYAQLARGRLQREAWPDAAPRPGRWRRQRAAVSPAPSMADLLAPVMSRLDELAAAVKSSRPSDTGKRKMFVADQMPRELRLVVEHVGLGGAATLLGVGGGALKRCLDGETVSVRDLDESLLHRIAVIIEHDLFDDDDDFLGLQLAVARARREARRSVSASAAWSEAS